MKFHHVRIDHVGTPSSGQVHQTEKVPPGPVSVFSGVLERQRAAGKHDFVQPISGSDGRRLSLRLTAERYAAAVVTFFSGETPLLISCYLKGTSRAADEHALVSLRNLISLLPGDTPLELPFDLAAIAERPVIISVTLQAPGQLAADQRTADNCNICCGAAFFTLAAAPSASKEKSGPVAATTDNESKRQGGDVTVESPEKRIDESAA